MKEKDLPFDREKHVCYSPKTKKLMLEHLRRRYPAEEAARLWEKLQMQYVDFLKDLPYLGGKACTHNGAGGTYDCIALFACYEVQEQKPTLGELYEMNCQTFLPSFALIGKLVDLNRPFLLRLLHRVFAATAEKDRVYAMDQPTGYRMEVEPYDEKAGIHYCFRQCPVAEFARAHHYLDLMPAFCNGDYPGIAYMHGRLIRTHTCANGELCDYWIVGDKSPCLQEHPQKTDEKGYWYNP